MLIPAKTTGTPNALNATSGRCNCAAFSRGLTRKGSLLAGTYASLRPAIIFVVHLITKLRARIVVEPWIIRWPGRHELASDIFVRAAVSEFIGSSGRPLEHGNKMTKWQDNSIPRAKQRESLFLPFRAGLSARWNPSRTTGTVCVIRQ